MTVSGYAKATTVAPERSRAELESIVRKYGCESFAFAVEQRAAKVAFQMRGRHVRFDVDLPEASEFSFDKRGYRRSDAARKAAQEAEERRLWRCLVLLVKAKLEGVESGIESFDEAFMPHILLPDGRTVGEVVVRDVEQAYTDGKMPKLLGA